MMETFLYYLGAVVFAATIARATLGAVDFLEGGAKHERPNH